VVFIVFSLILLFLFAKHISERIESLRGENAYERIREVLGVALLIVAWILLVLAFTLILSLFFYIS